MKIVHFADAHIDMVSQGKRDPASGLPIRVLDFLKALDTIVDTAIDERADLVLFAGDAYRDRTPVPTFQREFGKRIMRLSAARVPTLLLVGNHDLSPAYGRAHALQEFETLQVPFVHVSSQPELLGPAELFDVPLQVISLPWITRSGIMSTQELSGEETKGVFRELETRIDQLVALFIQEARGDLPLILAAHASVQGARYGGERSVMLGNDLVLSGSLMRNPRFAYVALGHIHKAQDLNEGSQPPVVYPGSIERVDFGEADDEKCFVIVHVDNNQETRVEWRKLPGRRFIDRSVRVESADELMPACQAALPDPEEMRDAIVRLTVIYPREYESMLDEAELRRRAETAFEFHFLRRPQLENRVRLAGDQTISSLSALELLNLYWKSMHIEPAEAGDLQKLAAELVSVAGQTSTD
ncbi:exodeoxyribonuclease I subunit D [Longilinea arvoryzae]|uniref:Nuclease SbcCD subunit D n=1 Tax=Longilinea arvoryzae TaxID=360412 RepID=A0A0S7BIZ4_9CHLR|nr:exonuclease SbcCD subunit D [Longilinea arvoryzae]GAP13883.1 exodeoxyribonuclease I subunit D [Longilinea arvoryzae]